MAEKDKFADEKLSDDELGIVAGGTPGQTADDSRFLNCLNGSCDRYGATKMFFDAFGERMKEIEKGWSTVGIKAETYVGVGINKYYLNGQEITQEQARQHAMNVTGNHMTEADWKY